MATPLQWLCEDQPSEASKNRALQVYAWLKGVQSITGIDRCRKFWTDGLFYYDFQLSNVGDRVRVWGGEAPFIGPLVFVTPMAGETADVWFYWYDETPGRWELVFTIDHTGSVKSSYIGGVNVDTSILSFAKKSSTAYTAKDPTDTLLSMDPPEFVYSSAWYESAFSILHNGVENELYLQNVNYPTGTLCAKFPSTIPANRIKLTTMNKLLYAYTNGEDVDGDNTGFGSVTAWLINVGSGGVASGAIETWTWRSRFFLRAGVEPKLYYGGSTSGGTVYGPIYANGPAYNDGEIQVKFACLVDDKYATPRAPSDPEFPEFTPPSGIQGFCEVLQKISGSYPDDPPAPSSDGDYNKAFFITSLYQGSKDMDLYYAPPFLTAWLIEHGGLPPEHTFAIDYEPYFGSGEGSAPEIYWWSGNWTPVAPEGNPTWVPPELPLQGIIANKNGDWTLHRYIDVTADLVAQGTNYIKHEVSSNGNLICIMTGGETITHIYIYDINKNEVVQDVDTNFEYTSGAFVPNTVRVVLADIPYPPPTTADIQFDIYPAGRAFTGSLACHFSSTYGIFSPGNPTFARCYRGFTVGNMAYGKTYELTEASATGPSSFVSIGHLRANGAGPYSATMFGETFSSASWSGFCEQFPYTIAYGTGGGVYNELYYALWFWGGVANNIIYPTGGYASSLVNITDAGFAIEN